MSRQLITILTIFCSTATMSQTLTFDSVVKRLYFGVDIVKASGSLVDSFKKVKQLYYVEPKSRQSSLNLAMEMNTTEAWSSRHIFSFSESPVTGFKIKTGEIEVLIGEAPKVKKLLGVEWQVDFGNENDGTLFFDELKKIFEPLSTKKKMEDDTLVGKIVQYSTRAAGVTGIKDITIIFGKSSKTNNYKISLSLMNEFVNE